MGIKNKMKSLSKNYYVLVGIVFFCLITVCSAVNVKFSYWGSQDEINMVDKLVATFEKKNPGIKIVKQHVNSDNYEQKLMIMIAGNDAPDVITIREVSFNYFAKRGFYLDLDSLIQKNNLNLNDFFSNVLNNFKLDGKIYGLPREFTPVVLYYNKDIFDKAGLEYPNDKWSWNDFLKAAQKLTIDKNNDGSMDQWGTFMTNWDALYLPIVFSYGGNILTDDGTKSYLTDSNTIEGFKFANDLIHKYKVAPPLAEADSYGWINGFAQGKFAMIFQGRWATPTYLGMKNVNWDVASMPKGKKKATVLYSSAFGISKKSKVADAAFKWIEFLTSPEGQKIYGGADALVVPANKKIAESKDFLTPDVAPANDQVFLTEAEKYGQVPPQTPSFAEMYEIVNRHVKEMFLGLTTPEDSLKSADNELNRMLKRKLRSLRRR